MKEQKQTEKTTWAGMAGQKQNKGWRARSRMKGGSRGREGWGGGGGQGISGERGWGWAALWVFASCFHPALKLALCRQVEDPVFHSPLRSTPPTLHLSLHLHLTHSFIDLRYSRLSQRFLLPLSSPSPSLPALT